jgi:hypothetical protein
MERRIKYWRSNLCEASEACEPQDVYEVGDSEPCLCGDPRCAATVEQGQQACIVVGSSPRHEYGAART